jgi:hypothetical protein
MSLIQSARDDLNAALAKLKELGHSTVARVEEIVHELEGDAPKLEAEAAADAADVAHTAETQGVQPAITEAEKDGVTLAEDAGHDVAAAIEGSNKPAEAAPVEAPASETTA